LGSLQSPNTPGNYLAFTSSYANIS
jgi:hypothetical protein